MNPSVGSGIYSSAAPETPVPEAPVQLPMKPTRKSRKGLVVGVILIVLAIGLGAAAVVIGMKGGGGGTTASAETSFNKLINYVTSGVEATGVLNEEYSAIGEYYFLNGWSNKEEKQGVYDTTKSLMDGFFSSYKDGENEVLNNLVKSVKEQFDFIYAIDLKEMKTGTAILTSVLKNGVEKTKQNLMGYYGLSEIENNGYVDDFLGAYEEWLSALSDEIELYKVNGCITDDKLDDSCMLMKNNGAVSEEMTKVFETIQDAYSYVIPYYNMDINFIANVYDINAVMHGELKVETEDE